MKRKLLFGAVVGLSLAASAQISVNRYGQLMAGSDGLQQGWPSTTLSSQQSLTNPGIGPDIGSFQTDSVSKICVLGDLIIKAKNVKFGDGFTVDKGGILEVVSK